MESSLTAEGLLELKGMIKQYKKIFRDMLSKLILKDLGVQKTLYNHSDNKYARALGEGYTSRSKMKDIDKFKQLQVGTVTQKQEILAHAYKPDIKVSTTHDFTIRALDHEKISVDITFKCDCNVIAAVIPLEYQALLNEAIKSDSVQSYQFKLTLVGPIADFNAQTCQLQKLDSGGLPTSAFYEYLFDIPGLRPFNQQL